MYQILNGLLVKTSGQKLDRNQSVNPPTNQTHINQVKTLMLLHGWGMNSQVWEPIREALEARYQVLWVDLPGHGFNQHVSASNLEHIVDLVTDITPQGTHIVAWSLGGMVAQALANSYPDKIISLTLVTSTPRFSQSVEGDWPHAMSESVLNRFADNLKHDTVKTLKGFIALQFMGVKHAKQAQENLIADILGNGSNISNTRNNTSNKDSDSVNSASTLKNGKKVGGGFLNDAGTALRTESATTLSSRSTLPTQEALDIGLEILKNADLRQQKQACPEYWIFAEYDRLIPKEVINDLISLRPDAQITLLEKLGHAPFITHPEIFMQHLNQFLDTQP